MISSALSSILHSGERLLQVIQDILYVLCPYRQPDRIGQDPLLTLFIFTQLRMGGRSRMNHQALHIGHIGQQRKQLQMIDEAMRFFYAAADIEGEDRCAAMRKVTLIERMIRMRRQRRVADAFHHRMRCQILDDRSGIFCVPLKAQGKRLGSLQKQECRKRRNARSAITQQHRPDIGRQRRILCGLDKRDTMIAVIGCTEKWEPA